MTDEQIDHANYILEKFAEKMQIKYERGALEHGGNLWDMELEELLDNAIDEAIDQVVYLVTAKDKIAQLRREYGESTH